MLQVDNSLALMQANTRKESVKIDSENDTKLKEQTDKFEAFFIKKILDISLKKEDTLFEKDAGDKIYRSMYNDALSESMSGTFGFSELLFNHLKERG
ncbi:MAG: rod-binding protein [Sulfurospirillum sp.]|nr:rod-binding protein [Sulfurospirillum sp.]